MDTDTTLLAIKQKQCGYSNYGTMLKKIIRVELKMLKLTKTSKDKLLAAQTHGYIYDNRNDKHIAWLLQEGYLIAKLMFEGGLYDTSDFNWLNTTTPIVVYPIAVLSNKGEDYLERVQK